jgi:hypothetical protein
MERLAVPWIFTGPSGSGKLSLARKWIEEAHGIQLQTPFEVRTFSVGDGYEARVLASPYHFEIDIPNLSMQDKQIIGELLTMFLSSGDVLNSLRSSSRKLVVLRRAHCLSLPAAIRVRSILQQFVLPANASGMIWFTAREVTGPLSLLEDALVPYRVPRMTCASWLSAAPDGYRTEEAWKQLEGRIERAEQMNRHFTSPTEWPRRIQDYYDEMLEMMVAGANRKKPPTMEVVEWIRERVYEVLSFCQTGPEIVDCCASAVTRLAGKQIPPLLFWRSMDRLAESEPHTSYRTPLSLEWALLTMYEEMRKSWAEINGARTTETVGPNSGNGQKYASSDAHRTKSAGKRIQTATGKV